MQQYAAPTVQAIAFDRHEEEELLTKLLDYLTNVRPTMAEIKDAVCEFYLTAPNEMATTRNTGAIPILRNSNKTPLNRSQFITISRWMLAYLAHRYTRCSTVQIAKVVGYADHTSVIYGIRQIEQLLLTRPLIRDDYDLLQMRLAEKVLLRRKEINERAS